ncbi:MAG: 4Fe-4S binding protein [Quisquiliibacterium sp.]
MSRYTDALAGDAQVLVGCTQEQALFSEIAASRNLVAPVRFVNLRERAGWGAESSSSSPKISALVSMAAAAVTDPAPAVPFVSKGRTLIIGQGQGAIDWAVALSTQLEVSLLLVSTHDAVLPTEHAFPLFSGNEISLRGWLGAFEASWTQRNPIDLDACVRCGACVAVCPEQAIDASFQIDLQLCAGHRKCVSACEQVGAIDFSRADQSREGSFDLVLDLRDAPAFAQADRPPGYFFPGPDPVQRARQALELAQMVGEFEKPQYFRYDRKICSHQRNKVDACNRCIEVCSTSAITPDGDGISVQPYLCQGCGGCATVCPSGALAHVVPGVPEIGRRLRLGLAAYRGAGGRDAILLFHDERSGRRLLDEVGRGRLSAGGVASHEPGVRGLPARVIPIEVAHGASVGIDLALCAISYGASRVLVLAGPDVPSTYSEAQQFQFDLANSLVEALGYQGVHFELLRVRDALEVETALHGASQADCVDSPASFAIPSEKRRAIDLAIDHLSRRAAAAGRDLPEQVALVAGAPFGSVIINPETCTMCKACVGACPQGALLDNPELPQLRFIERNCVQCSLCVKTCPENAISLKPRYLLTESARTSVVVHEGEPFNCVVCGKPFGSKQMVQSMVGRLSGHSMFSGQGTRRLQMCQDCRVVDMLTDKDEITIFDATKLNHGKCRPGKA